MFSAVRNCLLLSLMLCLCVPVSAQTDSLPEPEHVFVTAADGLVLFGDFYRLRDDQWHSAVLLLHGQGSSRTQWTPLIPSLLAAGFHVVNVDQRGFGETGGRRDLALMIDDTVIWLNWLNGVSSVEHFGVIGASMGAVPALGACAAVLSCATAILISPGDFPLLNEAVYERLSDRSVLFIVGRDDNVIFDTRRMFARMVGETALHIYPSAVHGSGYFSARSAHRESVTRVLIAWLDDHVR